MKLRSLAHTSYEERTIAYLWQSGLGIATARPCFKAQIASDVRPNGLHVDATGGVSVED